MNHSAVQALVEEAEQQAKIGNGEWHLLLRVTLALVQLNAELEQLKAKINDRNP